MEEVVGSLHVGAFRVPKLSSAIQCHAPCCLICRSGELGPLWAVWRPEELGSGLLFQKQYFCHHKEVECSDRRPRKSAPSTTQPACLIGS